MDEGRTRRTGRIVDMYYTEFKFSEFGFSKSGFIKKACFTDSVKRSKTMKPVCAILTRTDLLYGLLLRGIPPKRRRVESKKQTRKHRERKTRRWFRVCTFAPGPVPHIGNEQGLPMGAPSPKREEGRRGAAKTIASLSPAAFRSSDRRPRPFRPRCRSRSRRRWRRRDPC